MCEVNESIPVQQTDEEFVEVEETTEEVVEEQPN